MTTGHPPASQPPSPLPFNFYPEPAEAPLAETAWACCKAWPGWSAGGLGFESSFRSTVSEGAGWGPENRGSGHLSGREKTCFRVSLPGKWVFPFTWNPL